ncbi:MAG TPA: tyrosine-type recombinase/integrase [Streptosporangiaceae bacterium]|nr:tyrosine-type recombinase/integrase [Streptosporangiaceae bacterium]
MSAAGWQHRAPAGLLGKLLASVRPEFRAGVLVFDPDDPVFGGDACLVRQCGRTARAAGMCHGHHQRWADAGRPDPGAFAASQEAAGPWFGHAPLTGCAVPGCGFGSASRQMCARHLRAWERAGEPDRGRWLAAAPPVVPSPGQAACRVSYCELWAHPGAVMCYSHHRRWKGLGRPDLEEFIVGYDRPPDGRERADLTGLPDRLRLELQYALQCRHDDNMIKTRPTTIRSVAGWLAGSGCSSLLDRGEQDWRADCPPSAARSQHPVALLVYAHRQVTALAEGHGWDSEYARDTWHLRRLGIDSQCATLRFGGISQPWLRDLAKRWIRWRLGTGLEAQTCYRGVRALTRLAAVLADSGVTGTSDITRDVLERYLAGLVPSLAGKKEHRDYIGQVGTFLRDIRRHQWDTGLPASAVIFPEDYPRQVMAQVEDPANLGQWESPAYRLITLILIRCGLRITDVTAIPADCTVRDADGAPYLRYYNRKMKREALVPIDDELESLIAGQRERNQARWPGGTPVLFPRPTTNIDGTRPTAGSTYREALYRWLDTCDIRDEYGKPVHLTPHQWRHTLGTALINRDVPQHVVQKILDHDSPLMTAHYARLSDKTVREHWEKARKVNAEGQPVQIGPDGPLGDAAWSKHRLSRATQALPNGYCELPMVRVCPHANSCLTCPMFVTTAEFLPQHHAHRQQTLQIISAAEANGQARVAEMNRQVAGNLDKIIASLEDGGEEKEAAAGAS